MSIAVQIEPVTGEKIVPQNSPATPPVSLPSLRQRLSPREKREKGRQLSALQALASGRVWHMAAAQFFFAIAIAMYALSFWMPQVIKSLAGGRSNTRIGLLVMVPCLVAVIVMVLISPQLRSPDGAALPHRASDDRGRPRFGVARRGWLALCRIASSLVRGPW